jgi:hypothetical protein
LLELNSLEKSIKRKLKTSQNMIYICVSGRINEMTARRIHKNKAQHGTTIQDPEQGQ